MKVKNNLREVLYRMGIKAMSPTPNLLNEKLGGMTVHRFNKLIKNEGKDITVAEVQLLTDWLATLTNQPKTSINLLETAEAVAA